MGSRLAVIDGSLASDLWIFHAVAQSRTFEEASDRLAITQSAVSQRIARLEARLGTKLFVRKGRQAHLSPSGQLLLESTTTAFDAIISTVKVIGKPQATRVSCVPSLALEWLTPRLGDFFKDYPEFHVEIVGEIPAPDQRQMVSQNIDVRIGYSQTGQHIGPLLYSVIEHCFPVGSPGTVRQLLTGSDDEDAVVTLLHDSDPWENASERQAEWALWLRKHPVPWPAHLKRRNLFFNLAQLAYQAAASGSGVAMGRSRMVSRYLCDGSLEKFPNSNGQTEFAITVQTSGKSLSYQTSIFLDWLHFQFTQPC